MSDDLAAVLPYWGKAQPVDVGPLVEASASTGKTAKMRIYGPIASIGAPYAVSADEFGQALAALPDDTEQIELHIHSPGGSAFDGTAIKNQLMQHPAKVNVVVDGIAASAASMIAMAGDTVTVAPSAQIMVHDASALVIGQAADLAKAAEMLDSVSDSYADAYAAKAGGTRAEWRALMQPETWYTADEAVAAGLADRVLPKAKKPAEPSTLFDLTVFAHAGRDHAPAPAMPTKASPALPAEPPEKSPSTEEADAMSDTTLKALRERFGLGDDADESAVLAKVDELRTAPTDPPEVTEDAAVAVLAKASGVDADKVKAAVDGAKAGKVTVSETLLEELKANAKLGADARAKQLETERDDAIEAAFRAGKISAERRDTWRNAWDKDPDGTKSDLDSLEARFPVGQARGYAGSDDSDGEGTTAFTDDEATALAQLAGVSKEALING